MIQEEPGKEITEASHQKDPVELFYFVDVLALSFLIIISISYLIIPYFQENIILYKIGVVAGIFTLAFSMELHPNRGYLQLSVKKGFLTPNAIRRNGIFVSLLFLIYSINGIHFLFFDEKESQKNEPAYFMMPDEVYQQTGGQVPGTSDLQVQGKINQQKLKELISMITHVGEEFERRITKIIDGFVEIYEKATPEQRKIFIDQFIETTENRGMGAELIARLLFVEEDPERYTRLIDLSNDYLGDKFPQVMDDEKLQRELIIYELKSFRENYSQEQWDDLNWRKN